MGDVCGVGEEGVVTPDAGGMADGIDGIGGVSFIGGGGGCD